MPSPHLTAGELLSDQGPVAQKLRSAIGSGAYESRPEQIRMAQRVASALENRTVLLVEAGTGVGKSFAYLVPAILRCIERGERVVIATATIALQEQLINKDLPMLASALEAAGILPKADQSMASSPPSPGFALRVCLAKGRGNYLSIRRLKLASERSLSLLHDAAQRESLHSIEQWAYSTADGSLSTLPALARTDVWDHVRSDTDNCMGRKCPHFNDCFYQQARRELEQANLIICNHALFFSDLALRSRPVPGDQGAAAGGASTPQSAPTQIKAILPSYHHVIFDEAHNLEDAACEHFGLSLSRPRVQRLLRTLYSPSRRRGYLLDRSLALADAELVDRCITHVQTADMACARVFDDLLHFGETHSTSSGRIRAPDIVDNPLTPAMRELALSLRTLRQSIENQTEMFELGSFAKRASDIADLAEAMIAQTLSGYVYWVDVESSHHAPPGQASHSSTADLDDDHTDSASDSAAHRSPGPPGRHGRFGPRVTLACAPVDVGPMLKRAIFSRPEPQPVALDVGTEADDEAPFASSTADASETPAPAAAPAPGAHLGIILTSATLATRAVDENAHPEHAETAFAHVLTNLGIDKAETLQLGSPFDYRKQSKLIVDLTVPDPRASSGRSSGSSSNSKASASRRPASGPPIDTREFNRLLAQRIEHHVLSTQGGAFVLFTSNATMNACADLLRDRLRKRGHELFVQGRDGSRQVVLARFLESQDPVLFGAASFWQGVDVRGDRLRNVIITKLPFEPPDRPLTQARVERIELAGGNAFMQDALPRALIRFKQGFGRLIRSRSDRGQVVVLDPRIVTARYGRLFIQALPEGVNVEVIEPETREFDD